MERIKEFDIIVAAVSHDYYLKKPIKEILKKFKKEGYLLTLNHHIQKKRLIVWLSSLEL